MKCLMISYLNISVGSEMVHLKTKNIYLSRNYCNVVGYILYSEFKFWLFEEKLWSWGFEVMKIDLKYRNWHYLGGKNLKKKPQASRLYNCFHVWSTQLSMIFILLINIKMPSSTHQWTTIKMALCWRPNVSPTLNAGLMALWFSWKSGSKLLRILQLFFIFRGWGVQTPCSPLWIHA